MKEDMDQTFDAKFGSSFDDRFERTTQSSDWTVSDTTTDRQTTSDTTTTSVADDSYWDAFEQRMNDLNSDSTSDGWTSDFTSDRTADRTSDHTTDRQTQDSNDDRTSDSDDSRTSVSPSGSTEAQAEEYLHRYINQERQQRGLAPLNFDSDLRQTAREKSQDMANRGYFSHYDPEGDNFRDIYNQNGISRSECRVGAENIARTWFNRNVRTDTGSTVNYDNAQELADGLRRQWMTSDAHRDAILRSRYNSHGIGIEITSNGRVYASEHFCA